MGSIMVPAEISTPQCLHIPQGYLAPFRHSKLLTQTDGRLARINSRNAILASPLKVALAMQGKPGNPVTLTPLSNLSDLDVEIQNKKFTNWLSQAKRSATKIRPKAVGGGIFGCLSNFDNCRLEVTSDVTSSTAVERVGMDVCVKFNDSR